MTAAPAEAAPIRKPRCRLLDARLNRCASECLSEDGVQLCARHLAQAFSDYLRLSGGKLSVIGGQL